MQYLISYVYPSIATSDGWQYIILDDVALCISWCSASDPKGHQMKASDPKRVSDDWSEPVFGDFAWFRDVKTFLVRSSYARSNS